MADEEQPRPQKKAPLQDLADLRIGDKFGLNIRIFFEPIGILKCILIFTSLFALALTTSYSNRADADTATCQSVNNITYTLSLGFSYPYHPPSYEFNYSPSIPQTDNNTDCFRSQERKTFTGSAEYFTAMSSFTFIFAILSFPFYFLFYVPRYDLAKYLSIIDLIITCLLTFFYFFADIAWAAGIPQLNDFHSQLLKSKRELCLIGNFCRREGEFPDPKIQNSVQLSFSVLFGWVSFMLLAASIWFIYKDTIVHQERMGPLYRLSFFSRSKRGSYDVEAQSKAPQPEAQPEGGQPQPSQQQQEDEEGTGDVGPPPESRDEKVEY